MSKVERIALAGSYGSGKTVMSLALAEIFHVPRAHVRNIGTLYKEIFHQDKDPRAYTISELLSLGLVRFHSRIKQEGGGGFISDGSVINELAYGKARMSIERKTRKLTLKTIFFSEVYQGFAQRLERTIIDYAKSKYDIIFYLKPDKISLDLSETALLFMEYFETYFIKILDNNNIKYKVLHGDIHSFMETIVTESNKKLPSKEELDRIINEAKIQKQEFEKDFHFGDS